MSHLEFLPLPTYRSSGSHECPNLMAIFSLCESSDHLPTPSRPRESKAVLIDLKDSQDKLHSSFEHLASKKNKRTVNQSSVCANVQLETSLLIGAQQRVLMLTRTSEIDLRGNVLSIERQVGSPIIALIKDDGTVDIRDQSNLSSSLPTETVDKLFHAHQAGWLFQSGEPSMSPGSNLSKIRANRKSRSSLCNVSECHDDGLSGISR